MVSASIARNLRFLAGLLGLFQGLTWVILSAICIVLHLINTLDKLDEYDAFKGVVQLYIYGLFLNDHYNINFDGQTLTPYAFHILAWISAILNLIWMGISIYILFRKDDSLKFWSFVVWIICLWEFIFVIILGTDYQICLDDAKYQEFKVSLELICSNGILPVLLIVSKAFVLWMVNLALSIVLVRIKIEPKEDHTIPEPSPLQRTYSIPHAQFSPNVPFYRGSPPNPISPNQRERRFSFSGTPSSPNIPNPSGSSPSQGEFSRQDWRAQSLVQEPSEPRQRSLYLAPPARRWIETGARH